MMKSIDPFPSLDLVNLETMKIKENIMKQSSDQLKKTFRNMKRQINYENTIIFSELCRTTADTLSEKLLTDREYYEELNDNSFRWLENKLKYYFSSRQVRYENIIVIHPNKSYVKDFLKYSDTIK